MRRQRQRSRCSPRQGPSLVFHQQAEVAFSQLPLGGTSRRVQKYPAFRHITAQLVSQTGKDSAEILPGSLLGLGRCESRHGPGLERFGWVADLNRGLTSRAGARRAVLLAASQPPGRGGEAIRGEKIASGAPSPWQPSAPLLNFPLCTERMLLLRVLRGGCGRKSLTWGVLWQPGRDWLVEETCGISSLVSPGGNRLPIPAHN